MTPERLARIEAFVDRRLGGPIRIDQLAGVVGMSASCFSRVFKASTGQTPHQFVVARRVQRARGLIASGRRLTLAQIADRCGFADQAHLTRAFRRVLGTTPARFCRDGATGSR